MASLPKSRFGAVKRLAAHRAEQMERAAKMLRWVADSHMTHGEKRGAMMLIAHMLETGAEAPERPHYQGDIPF